MVTAPLPSRLATRVSSRPTRGCCSSAAKARLNILISGGTGSGKTTLLNALSHKSRDGQDNEKEARGTRGRRRLVAFFDRANLRLSDDKA